MATHLDIDVPLSAGMTEDAVLDSSAAMVRIDALRNFEAVVTRLGGDPVDLLRRSKIDPGVLDNRNAVISYRMMVHLLERAATELACPDFGMRLAMEQGGAKVLGPLEVAMQNSDTLRHAFRYCAEHIHAYSSATQISLEDDRPRDRTFMRFEILLSRLPYQRQAVEQALLLTHVAARQITSETVRAREVWFSHEPCADPVTYRRNFDTIVRFGQPSNGLFFANSDLSLAISEPDPQLYDMATSFIDIRFPAVSLPISTRVRSIVSRLLVKGDCTNDGVAAYLGLHPRTLQRRLREEGLCFEKIKDSVRRDAALRYLTQADMPLTRVAEMLGYSEASVLSRSCLRWFGASPKRLRSEQGGVSH